jgi:hypothetical protein
MADWEFVFLRAKLDVSELGVKESLTLHTLLKKIRQAQKGFAIFLLCIGLFQCHDESRFGLSKRSEFVVRRSCVVHARLWRGSGLMKVRVNVV